MITVTNINKNYPVTVCGKQIRPGCSYSFETADIRKLNYLVSTGDIKIDFNKVIDTNNRIKSASRKTQSKDTIIIDGSANSVEDSSNEVN